MRMRPPWMTGRRDGPHYACEREVRQDFPPVHRTGPPSGRGRAPHAATTAGAGVRDDERFTPSRRVARRRRGAGGRTTRTVKPGGSDGRVATTPTHRHNVRY